MNNLLENETINVENMIYEINGIEVMLDSEISVTKWQVYLYNEIIIHYDISKPI